MVVRRNRRQHQPTRERVHVPLQGRPSLPNQDHRSRPRQESCLAFLETISQLRPQLHRYCSRMTGSITDGEDVVQDALFRAYRSLETFDDTRPLTPWLFRIAHNQCIDFLRSRGVRVEAETMAAEPDFNAPPNVPGAG